MCTAPKPKIQPLPPQRALARAPQRIRAYGQRTTQGAQSTRSTVVNPDGVIVRAPTAVLGGSRQTVVLGG